MGGRRIRAFKRWMSSQGVDCSDALSLIDLGEEEEGVCVRAVCDLQEGDLVATIPKRSCLTIKTSGARELIESAGLEGYLGLAVALMYEKSLGHQSPWFGYLQLLPHRESIPLVWTLGEVDSLLSGTEIHKIVKEDKALIYEDWKECILPLTDSDVLKINPYFFSVEEYFAARSLIASRSFEIDEYHGFGMVPLADLFNHKTGAEDVHFTAVSSNLETDNYSEDDKNSEEFDFAGSGERLTKDALLKESSSGCNLELSSSLGSDSTVLEMILVKDVKAGVEVFNTYGSLGNAALLHRYGFTEPDNPYDIVNIDLDLVLQWCSSLFSSRHGRARLSLWRRLDYSGCISQDSEYFEITYGGEPQVELLVLLYIMLLPEEAYCQLDLTASTVEDLDKSISLILPEKGAVLVGKSQEVIKDMLLTEKVRDALSSLADIRDSFYGSNTVEEDIKLLKTLCRVRDRKLYNSLTLRVCERRILGKLRIYAARSGQSYKTAYGGNRRKKMKKTAIL